MENINNLKQLFKADFRHVPASTIRDFEATEEIQQLRLSIKSEIPNSQWEVIRTELFTQTESLLDIDLHSILVKSWKTHQDVRREVLFQQESKNTNAAVITLADHEIRTTHSPSLVTQINSHNTINLRFFIGIVLHLKGVSLKIQNGEIKEILSGKVSGNGFMQYQNATLIEKDFLGFDISHTVDNSKLNLDKPPEEDTAYGGVTSQYSTISTKKQTQAGSFQRNIVQFIVGISLAMLAVFIFWQFTGA